MYFSIYITSLVCKDAGVIIDICAKLWLWNLFALIRVTYLKITPPLLSQILKRSFGILEVRLMKCKNKLWGDTYGNGKDTT